MSKLIALKALMGRAQKLEDFLQGDKGDNTIESIDPLYQTKEINVCVKSCQELITWTSDEIKKEFDSSFDMSDEVFEEEDYSGMDEKLADAGHSRGDF